MLVEKDLLVAKAEADERKKGGTKTAEMSECLTQQLLEAQKKISEQEHSLAEITHEKDNLESDLWKIVESRRKLITLNDPLTTCLVDLESDSGSQQSQLQALSDQIERKTHFRKVFIELEHRISNLAITREEVTADKNVQLERINEIIERISELDIEEEKLHCEQQEVEAIHDQRENDLTETVMKLEEHSQNDYQMVDMFGNSDVDRLKAAVTELGVFLESSRMRMSEIGQRMEEINEEKSVLLQQRSDALERKIEYVIY
jgi:chromosome segregation ATPase